MMEWNRRWRIWQIKFLKSLYRLNAPRDFYLLFLASLVGIFTGLGAYLLNLIVDFVRFLLYENGGHVFFGPEIADYFRILYPAIGGLAVGLLTYHFSPEVKGHGIPGVMDTVANKGGLIRKRVAFLTSINSGTTIGSGGSAGKEGPIVQIGAAIGSVIGQLFRVSQRRLKILVGCGSAAGLAAVFNAPIAGVVFAVEVILAEFSLTVFTPIVISAVIATAISHSLVGTSPLFAIPEYSLNSPAEFPIYLFMGLAGGILSVFFIRMLYRIEDFFEEQLKTADYLKPAIGGLLTGILAFGLPELYGFDDSATHTALTGHTGIQMLAILVIAKMLATSFTLGSGGTGGLFTPSLFIGAMFGALYGSVAGRLFPDFVASPGAYALVGMGVIVAGTIHAPLSALLIIFEITGDYHIILPLMLGTVTSTLVARWIEPESIYTMKVSLFSNRVSGGRNVRILEETNIQGLIMKDAPTVREETGFNEILDRLLSSEFNTFPVLNRDNRITGIITLRDIRPIIFDRDVAPLLVATDVMSENVFFLEPEESMAAAIRKLEIDDYELLPVVDSASSMVYQGVVTRDKLMRYYTKQNVLLTEQ